MLVARYTEGDRVQYQIENSRYIDTATIVKGPYREGVWWEYLMADGSMVRDHEIISLIGRVD